MKWIVLPLLSLLAGVAFAQVVPAPAPATTSAPATTLAGEIVDVDIRPEGIPVDINIPEGTLAETLEKFAAAAHLHVTVATPQGRIAPRKPMKLRTDLHMKNTTVLSGLVELLLNGAEEGPSFAVTIRDDDFVNTGTLGGRFFSSGAFLVNASKFQRDADFAATPEKMERFFLHLKVVAEPRLIFVNAPEILQPVQAMDSTGQSMIPAKDVALPNTPPAAFTDRFSTRRRWTFSTKVQLSTPEKPGDRVKLVRGNIPVDVVSRMLVMKFNKHETKKFEIDGLSISCTYALGVIDGAVVIRATWDKDRKADNNAEVLRRLAASYICMTGPDGAHVRLEGEAPVSTPGMFTIAAVIPRKIENERAIGGVYEIRVEIPLQTSTVQIPYLFDDLPLRPSEK